MTVKTSLDASVKRLKEKSSKQKFLAELRIWLLNEGFHPTIDNYFFVCLSVYEDLAVQYTVSARKEEDGQYLSISKIDESIFSHILLYRSGVKEIEEEYLISLENFDSLELEGVKRMINQFSCF